MKRLLFALCAGLLGCAISAHAQASWGTDLDAALAKAKKEKKHVLLDFTGSDWCNPCMKLKKEVFSTKEFADYAAKNLVLVEVDFPRNKKQSAELVKSNEALKEKYKANGFPTIIILNTDGKEVSRTVGNVLDGTKAWIAEFEKARKK